MPHPTTAPPTGSAIWHHLCAACLLPIDAGTEGIVTVGTANPASVYVHDEHRAGARRYPRDLDALIAAARATSI